MNIVISCFLTSVSPFFLKFPNFKMDKNRKYGICNCMLAGMIRLIYENSREITKAF